ncbi:hypothetical protein [Streptomyces ardesiacus]|uniref:hypothetical protein n=1 Tax=Streptomyces ardesiacus TaxID=285564 RepID=UPI00201F5A18|nr:hypothetical protein [Streptomyces ardesiacus]MCL7370413.1 hypothetical protein [Streptomyces ardesiacus]
MTSRRHDVTAPEESLMSTPEPDLWKSLAVRSPDDVRTPPSGPAPLTRQEEGGRRG